jgi:hypothetical protein
MQRRYCNAQHLPSARDSRRLGQIGKAARRENPFVVCGACRVMVPCSWRAALAVPLTLCDGAAVAAAKSAGPALRIAWPFLAGLGSG